MTHNSELIADVLIHLARRSVQCSASALTSAQWAALRFFAHANHFSRQPSSFASYHGTTRGTDSGYCNQSSMARDVPETDRLCCRFESA